MKNSEKWLRHGESCNERGEGQEDNMEGRLIFVMMRPHLMRMECWPSVEKLEPLKKAPILPTFRTLPNA